MRFIKVSVRSFQGVKRSDVEFGPGLNVVFGPNDLGKSTLATAIRGALLVPSSSSESNRYRCWFADVAPEVTVTFEDDEGRFWRVKKTFGQTQSSAELHYSKDGLKFDRDSAGREVDDKLRQVLAWGIPSPGGKGAPRKLPTSFLAQVLLADQSSVDTIFEQSLETDDASSGKDRLRKVLAALAEDPRFKKVLNAVQSKVDELFTPTGQRKRGRGSPFLALAEEVGELSRRLDDLKKVAIESEAVGLRVREVQERFRQARETHDEAVAALEEMLNRRERGVQRAKAEQAVADAKALCDAIEAQALEVKEREDSAGRLEVLAREAQAQSELARARVQSAEAAVRGAEEALRMASSAEGDHEREVARARLGTERAELTTKEGQRRTRLGDLETLERATSSASQAADAKQRAHELVGRARGSLEAAERASLNAESELKLARAGLTYGQWREACDAGRLASDGKANADAARLAFASKTRAADECDSQTAERAKELEAITARLPDAGIAERIVDLSQRIAIAEAALGGGFSITLRGSGKARVHLAADGETRIGGVALDGSTVVNATRQATLRVEDLLDVDIIAGAAEKRAALNALRQSWDTFAEPALRQAGASTVAQLRELQAAAADLHARIGGLRAQAKELRLEADSARQAAAAQDLRVEEWVLRSGEQEALHVRLREHDINVLDALFSRLGTQWKASMDALIQAKEAAMEAARAALDLSRRESDQADFRRIEAETKATEMASDVQERLNTLGLSAEGLGQALAAIRVDLAQLAARQQAIGGEMARLDESASSAVKSAQNAFEAAKKEREGALEGEALRSQARDIARSQFHSAQGEVLALREALRSSDRGKAEAAVAAALTEFARFATDPVVTEEDVAVAERREADSRSLQDRARDELHHAEGALTKVGGLAVEEELKRDEEALNLAKERQQLLETDADAWKLLRETLTVAEREDGAHLGNSLAPPVSARFSELTKGRYKSIRIDQHLGTGGIDVSSANPEDALGELSVGTRDQLATLLRVTIAEHLKSGIVLDDHLVHTDPERLAWFRRTLRTAALQTQVIVISCRPEDYLSSSEIPEHTATQDFAGGAVRAINLARLVERYPEAAPMATQNASGG